MLLAMPKCLFKRPRWRNLPRLWSGRFHTCIRLKGNRVRVPKGSCWCRFCWPGESWWWFLVLKWWILDECVWTWGLTAWLQYVSISYLCNGGNNADNPLESVIEHVKTINSSRSGTLMTQIFTCWLTICCWYDCWGFWWSICWGRLITPLKYARACWILNLVFCHRMAVGLSLTTGKWIVIMSWCLRKKNEPVEAWNVMSAPNCNPLLCRLEAFSHRFCLDIFGIRWFTASSTLTKLWDGQLKSLPILCILLLSMSPTFLSILRTGTP